MRRFMAGLRMAFSTRLESMSTWPSSRKSRKPSWRRSMCESATLSSDLREMRAAWAANQAKN